MPKINWPILALIVANIIWGAASPIFKYSLENIPPFSLAFLRFLIASIILYPFIHRFTHYSDLKDKKLWAFALTGVTLNIAFFFWAIERVSSINAPVIASSGPIFILLFSMIFLKEKVRTSYLIGSVISFLGILVLVVQPLWEQGFDGGFVGNLLMILATLAAVANTLIGHDILTPKNSLGYTFWAFFIGTLSFIPMAFREYLSNPLWMANLDIRGWTGIIFGALLSSTVAYCLYFWAIARLPASKTTIFTYLDPVVAVLIAYPLLSERISPPFIAGAVLVFAGILIAEKRLPWHPIHKLFSDLRSTASL